MTFFRLLSILFACSFAVAGNAQLRSNHPDTILWSAVEKGVVINSRVTIQNDTPFDQTITTFLEPQQFSIKYNNRDTTLQHSFITLSPFVDQPISNFVLKSNTFLTIVPLNDASVERLFFDNPHDVMGLEGEIRIGIISSYLEVIVCGMVLMMALYMIGTYAQLRNQVYFYYTLYLLFTVLFLTVLLLYATQYFQEKPSLKAYLHHFTQAASHACYFQFVRYFIQTRKLQPFFDKLLNWATIFSLGYILMDGIGLLVFPQYYPHRIVWDGVQIFYLISGVAFLVVWVTRSPTPVKKYLIVGTSSLLIGGIVGLLVLFMPNLIEGLPVPLNIQVFYFRVGILIEIIAFALGLGYMQRLEEINSAKVEATLEQEHQQVLKLQELDTLKTKFFSNITHEFRTPLTLIQGPARELYQKEKDPESKQLLSLISSNSERLLKLINQLLDLAKLESSEMKLNLAPVDLASLIKVTSLQFTSMAMAKGIDYSYQAESNLPIVMADAEKLEAMISNLLSNAIKFTDSGGRISVNASWMNEHFIVRVSDTGRGIPVEKLEHIFDRFYQVNPTDSSHSEGTGIGLALVKEYTELMKGILEVESKVGLGTMFQIKLRLKVSDQAETIQQPVESHHQEYEPVKGLTYNGTNIEQAVEQPLVLLVEDTEDIRTFIKACLGPEFRYCEARHGREGLEMALHQIPDLIISDLMMPEMDGVELCRHLKNDRRTDHVPLIMLTAKAAIENKLEGLQSGADDYLVKPFNKTELLLKVRNLISLRKNLQNSIRQTFLSQPSTIQAVSAEEQFIVKARIFVEEHIKDETLSVETLAHEMNLSREQCYRKIIAITGISPSAFIRKLKLNKASQLLHAKWGTISQVAYETGFENLSYFSKAFKEEFGRLPSEAAVSDAEKTATGIIKT